MEGVGPEIEGFHVGVGDAHPGREAFVSSSLRTRSPVRVVGLPENVGAILGALTAAFVFMDPIGVFWGATEPVPPMAIRTSPAGLDGSHSTL